MLPRMDDDSEQSYGPATTKKNTTTMWLRMVCVGSTDKKASTKKKNDIVKQYHEMDKRT